MRATFSLLHGSRRLVLLAGLFGTGAVAHAQAEETYEDEQVKAAFIYHFATFVEWPPADGERRDFLVAVLDDDAVAAELERFLPGREITGRTMRSVRIERLDDLEALEHVDMLFVGAAHDGRVRDVTRAVGNSHTLVVTDTPGALDEGSMINFEVVDERVRFEISLRAAQEAGLELSSRLLSAAMFVDTTSALFPPSSAIMVAL